MTQATLDTCGTIRVLDIDPDLAQGLQDAQLREARAGSQAVVLELPGPEWDPEAIRQTATRGWLGLYLIDGVLIRMVNVGRRTACELFGPGDLIRPWDADGEYEPLSIGLAWRVPRRTRLAVLDTRFAQSVGRWPTVVSSLMERVATRGRSLALAHAVSQLPRTDARLLVSFWLLAERWGKVGREGITITLPLTHEMLSMIVGVRRPSVTLALRRLAAAGLLTRPRRETWVLTHQGVDYLHDPESLDLLGEPVVGDGKPVAAGG